MILRLSAVTANVNMRSIFDETIPLFCLLETSFCKDVFISTKQEREIHHAHVFLTIRPAYAHSKQMFISQVDVRTKIKNWLCIQTMVINIFKRCMRLLCLMLTKLCRLKHNDSVKALKFIRHMK